MEDGGVSEARVLMEDFTYYRYSGERLKSRLSSRQGRFYEPNRVELEGEVRSRRYNDGGLETVSCEAATTYFKAKSLAQMMGDTALDRAELMGFVEVLVKEHLLSTDYAEYLSDEDLIWSSRPVRLDGPSGIFEGDGGFFYRLEAQTLDLNGGVRGVVQPDER